MTEAKKKPADGPTYKQRTVIAVQDCYIDNVLHLKGTRFAYAGPPEPTVFVDLGDEAAIPPEPVMPPGTNVKKSETPTA